MQFKPGDRVSFYGVEGIVESNQTSLNYPIQVRFSSGKVLPFSEDGKFFIPNTPLLRKITTVEGWINIYSDGVHSSLYNTKSQADKYALYDRKGCVKLYGSYEVEA